MESSASSNEHDAGRFEGYQSAVAACFGDPALGVRAWGSGTDSRGDEDNTIGREQLHVDADPRTEITRAGPDDRAAGRRLETGASPDRAGLPDQRRG